MRVNDFAKEMLKNAQQNSVSDIYILPSVKGYELYFRAAAQREAYFELAEADAQKLIVHLKYLANMNVGENRRIQLGAVNYQIEKQILRLRISTIGDYQNRESMVIRLLHDFNLNNVNFILKQQQAEVEKLIDERGLYLFCGPVGSGKTTLMNYLADLKFSEQQRISIEDPVEIENSHILQLQVNEAIGLNYPELVKLSLRHRPDLLIVGEIRDLKTAKAVIQAALTGHTVFSTVHAKSPSTIVARLLELGISESEIAHALKGTVYQRLLSGVQGEGILLQMDQTTFIANEKWNQYLEELWQNGIISKEIQQREAFNTKRTAEIDQINGNPF